MGSRGALVAVSLLAAAAACGDLVSSPAGSPDDAGADGAVRDAAVTPPPPAFTCQGSILADTFDRAGVKGPWDYVSTPTPAVTMGIDTTRGASAPPSLRVAVTTEAGARYQSLVHDFSPAPANLVVRASFLLDDFIANNDDLTALEIDTGGSLNIKLNFTTDSSVYLSEQDISGSGKFNDLSNHVVIPKGAWVPMEIAYDSAARKLTFQVAGAAATIQPFTLDHGAVTSVKLGAVYSAASGVGSYSVDDVCVF